jgi:hypothetical protein
MKKHLRAVSDGLPWWPKILLGLYLVFVVAFMGLILFGLFLAVLWLNQHVR